MQRSYVAKKTVNFPDYELYVRLGDILVYDASHGNTLTVYRSGSIVKSIKTSSLSIAAMCKTKMLEEIIARPAAPAPKPVKAAPPKPVEASKPKPQPKVKLDKKATEAVKESLQSHIKGEPTLTTEEVLATLPEKVKSISAPMGPLLPVDPIPAEEK